MAENIIIYQLTIWSLIIVYQSCKEVDFRLPLSLVPIHYDIVIVPEIKNNVFEGFVNITIKVEEETDKIVLNILDFTIDVDKVKVYKFELNGFDSFTNESTPPEEWVTEDIVIFPESDENGTTTLSINESRSNALHTTMLPRTTKSNRDDETTLQNTNTEDWPTNADFTYYSTTFDPISTHYPTENSEGGGTTDAPIENTIPIFVLNVTHIYPKEMVIILLEKPLIKSEIYYVTIFYTGRIHKSGRGLYKLRYKHLNEEMRFLVVSKLEPTYARSVFPCFDEPNFKARFSVKIHRPSEEGYIAVSNMEMLTVEQHGVHLDPVVTFKTTVKVSTYTLCFFIGGLAHIDQNIKSRNGTKIKLRGFVETGKFDKIKFALKVTASTLLFYEHYFRFNYTLAKLDVIALTSKRYELTMGNRGVLLFNAEDILLIENHCSSHHQHKVIARIIRELCHIWFGNFVTMNWWSDIWLIFGIAGYFERFATATLFPEWGSGYDLAANRFHKAMHLDQELKQPIALTKTVKTADEIKALFTPILVPKATAIINMLVSVIGNDIFQKSLENFLTKYGNSVATAANFFEAIDDVMYPSSISPISNMLDSWITKPSFPLVKIVRKSIGFYTLTQEVFKPIQLGARKLMTIKWTIPITFITSLDPNKTLIWFPQEIRKIEIITKPDIKWIKLNVHQLEYYRVMYDKNNWEKLTDDFDSLSDGDKVCLLDDSFALAESSLLPYKYFLQFLEKIKYVHNYSVWKVAIDHLRILHDHMDKGRKGFVKYFIFPLFDNITQALGWQHITNEQLSERNLRQIIYGFSCFLKHKACELGLQYFRAWRNNHDIGLTPDLRRVIYRYGMEVYGTPQLWNEIFFEYLEEPNYEEKANLRHALCIGNSMNEVYRILDMFGDEQSVPEDQFMLSLVELAESRVGLNAVWRYLTEKWTVIEPRLSEKSPQVDTSFEIIFSRFKNAKKKQQVEQFMNKTKFFLHKHKFKERVLRQIHYNINWLKHYEQQFLDLDSDLNAPKSAPGLDPYTPHIALLPLIIIFVCLK